MNTQKFTDLPLIAPLQMALREENYETPTPIQAAAIPIILQGQDLLGVAQTGTGKTAAFCLPILQNLSKHSVRREPKTARALILTPTRELAIQIHQSLQTYGKHMKMKHAVIFGGVGQAPQVRALADGVDVLVATPGRLLDLIGQKYLRLDRLEIFVLDEADRMLDMGFIQDIKRILPLLPKQRHNLFFSATMPDEIQKLSQTILVQPKKVEVTPVSSTAEKIDQKVMFVERKDKLSLLLHLLQDRSLDKVLVFVQMKHGANRVVEKLEKNRVPSAAIHGNKSQGARQKALEDFRLGKIRVLVATDIAARGIDIDGISHVINFELPHVPESYVHRIGRTARAGAEGKSIAFCTSEEKSYLFAIQKTTRQDIPVDNEHPFHSDGASRAAVTSVGRAKAAIEQRSRSHSSETYGRREGGGPRPHSGGPGSGSGARRRRRGGRPNSGSQASGSGTEGHRKEATSASGGDRPRSGGDKPRTSEKSASRSHAGGSSGGAAAPSGGKSGATKKKFRFFGFGRK